MTSTKRFLAAGLLGTAVLLAGSASWAQMKVGFLNSEEILAKYKPYQEAQKEYQRYEEELNRDFSKLNNELEKMKETYERQKLLLSEKRKEEEQQAIQKKQADLQRFVEEVMDPERGKLARKNQDLSGPILAKVNEVVQQVAKENGYDYIINATALAYANEDHNMTTKILEALESQLEAELKEKQTIPGR